MIVLGLDFESTFTDPIDPTKARIIETGAVLWDTERKMPLEIFNQVNPWLATFGPFDPRVTELTGLTEDDLNAHGRPLDKILDRLQFMMIRAEAVVAHNGTLFDKPLLESELKRIDRPAPNKLWFDTCCDVPYPKSVETRKLAFLAPAHGFLNPFSHRAVFDVLSMLRIMSGYDISEIHRRSIALKVRLRAVTSKPWEDGGKSNQIAKDNGFRFDGITKSWTKIVLADEQETACKVVGLKIEVIK